MVDLGNLAEQLTAYGAKAEDDGFLFEVNTIPGDVDVLQVVVEDRDELPIFVSASESQLLCIAYLFRENEVREDAIADMHRAMLASNVPMPLSSFAVIDDQYVVFGALSVNSGIEDIVHELETLASNAADAIEAMQSFLK